MGWQEDIREWSTKNDKRAEVQERVLVDKGWDPTKYTPEMKSALFDYLDKWNTLSVKTLPAPATSKRRNPTPSSLKKKFTQFGPWKIWSYPKNEGYVTTATNGTKILEFDSNSYLEALHIHLFLSETV